MRNYIKRDIKSSIKRALEAKYIVAILGARQTGKTTLMNRIKDDYIKSGFPPERAFIFNFDDVILRNNATSDFNFILKTIEKSIGKSLKSIDKPLLLCIDEAQKVPEIFGLIKIIYDNQKEKVLLLITGSSSLDIQKRSAESLAGRIQYFYLNPLSISEILKDRFSFTSKFSLFKQLSSIKLDYKELKQQQAQIFGNWERQQEFKTLLERCLLDGGLPAVWQNPKEKDRVYKSMVETYLEKDIRSLQKVGSLNDFTQLLRILSLELGSLANLSKLSQSVGIALNTLKKYYSILISSFVLNKLSPLVKARKKLVKSPKIYFFDVGVANYLARREVFEHLKASKIEGAVFENILLKSLESYNSNLLRPASISFWRDYQGREIDFVLTKGDRIIPIEATLESSISSRKKRNLSHFFNNFKEAKFGLVIYTGDLKEINILGRRVFLIPWWMWW